MGRIGLSKPLNLERSEKMKFGEFEHTSSLREQLAVLLREAIFTGKLKPGERIVESQLARDMQVGQPSIREALQDLEHEGLITRISKRGCRVTDLSIEDITKIYDVRTELEVLAVARIPSSELPGLCKSLENALAQMEYAEKRRDVSSYSKADFEFHRAIWKASGNELLVKALNVVTMPLWAFSMIYFYRYHIKDGFDAANREMHRQILKVITSKASARKKQAAIRKMMAASLETAQWHFRLQQQDHLESSSKPEFRATGPQSLVRMKPSDPNPRKLRKLQIK